MSAGLLTFEFVDIVVFRFVFSFTPIPTPEKQRWLTPMTSLLNCVEPEIYSAGQLIFIFKIGLSAEFHHWHPRFTRMFWTINGHQYIKQIIIIK